MIKTFKATIEQKEQINKLVKFNLDIFGTTATIKSRSDLKKLSCILGENINSNTLKSFIVQAGAIWFQYVEIENSFTIDVYTFEKTIAQFKLNF
tara:strand:- start:84 stop:365 length:282 start_codon:yes stop_codon:yes gene_type:complete